MPLSSATARLVARSLRAVLLLPALGLPVLPAARALAAPREVTVSHPVVREVGDFEDLTGRTEAAQGVELRARVSGTIDKVAFQPGMTVKQGDVLFEIDPRPYQAELIKAEAEVQRAQARLKRWSAARERAKALRSQRSLGQDEYEQAEGERDAAAAALQAAQASLDLARLNLEWTRVKAPISGQISVPCQTAGDIAVANTTLLARIVSLDPMGVGFDVDERTVLRLRRTGREGKGGAVLPVAFGLADERDFPHRGKLTTSDTRLNPDTGTARWRAVVPNPDRILLPGMFVRVRLTTGPPSRALLIPERAVGTDQGRRFALAVTGENILERREVQLGPWLDGLWVVREGLSATDSVVIDGINGLEPGMTVQPRTVTLPATSPGS